MLFCAFDLDAEPFLSWTGRDLLVARLLEVLLGEVGQAALRPRQPEMARIGYQDLAGQLRLALDQFPGVLVVPFSLVAALASLYIIIIGPLDYLLLRKAAVSMRWTWLTFPLTVALFVALTGFLAHYWKGSQLGLNQVDLVDIDLASGWMRGTTWAHLYSPRTQTFDLALEPTWPPRYDPVTSGAALTWHGLPGRGFGGMESTALSGFQTAPYDMERSAVCAAAGGWACRDSLSPSGPAAACWVSGGVAPLTTRPAVSRPMPMEHCRARSAIRCRWLWTSACWSTTAGPTRWDV